jgi:hypothetical protein
MSFTLAGYGDALPAGEYEVVVEEELLQGLSFEAYRRTATYLTVRGTGPRAGRTEMRQVTQKDLEAALSRDRAAQTNEYQKPALED